MLKLGIEDLKVEFVRNVFESITKQIQQIDIKVSILLSWNGAMAVMLAKQVTDMVSQKMYHWYLIGLMTAIVAGMVIAGVYCYSVLKPRKARGPSEGFAGLLYAGDIQNLGKSVQDRIVRYSEALLNIEDYDGFYRQFIRSIVLISGIQIRKNDLFNRGLIATVVTFTLLLGLVAAMSILGKS